MLVWLAYLSGVGCRLFAYGPADATASQNPVTSCLIQSETGFYLSSKLAYPGCSGKEAVKWVQFFAGYVTVFVIYFVPCAFGIHLPNLLFTLFFVPFYWFYLIASFWWMYLRVYDCACVY